MIRRRPRSCISTSIPLRYRLQRIEAITGMKINQLTDALRLYIGMLMHD